MCYGAKPVITPSGTIEWVPRDAFKELYSRGEIVVRKDGYHYAKDTMASLIRRRDSTEVEVVPMRWDLVPRGFLQREDLPKFEAIRRKNSRAKDPLTGKPLGFDAYNARVETVTKLFSFKKPWAEGLRMATPVTGFKERPNMEGAPQEFTGREYEILLDGTYWLAGLYDRWSNTRGETLDSFAILTTDSLGNDKIRSIWHERTPIILRESQLAEWLDPRTPPARALDLCRLFPADSMEIREVIKDPTSAPPSAPPASSATRSPLPGTRRPRSRPTSGDSGQTSLDLG